jgi:hypothetical protein
MSTSKLKPKTERMPTEIENRISNIYKFAYVVDSICFTNRNEQRMYIYQTNQSYSDMYNIDSILYQTEEDGDLITSCKKGQVPILYHLRYLTQLISIPTYNTNQYFLDICEEYCKEIETTLKQYTTPTNIIKVLQSYDSNQWITYTKTIVVPKSASLYIDSAMKRKNVNKESTFANAHAAIAAGGQGQSKPCQIRIKKHA